MRITWAVLLRCTYVLQKPYRPDLVHVKKIDQYGFGLRPCAKQIMGGSGGRVRKATYISYINCETRVFPPATKIYRGRVIYTKAPVRISIVNVLVYVKKQYKSR